MSENLPAKAGAQLPSKQEEALGDIEDFEIQRLARNSGAIHTAICVFTNTRKTQGQARLVHELKKAGSRVVVVLLGYPTNLPSLVEADAPLQRRPLLLDPPLPLGPGRPDRGLHRLRGRPDRSAGADRRGEGRCDQGHRRPRRDQESE